MKSDYHAFKEYTCTGCLVSMFRSSRVSTSMQVIKPYGDKDTVKLCSFTPHAATFMLFLAVSLWHLIFVGASYLPLMATSNTTVVLSTPDSAENQPLQQKHSGNRNSPVLPCSYWQHSQPDSSVADLDKNKALDPSYQWGWHRNVSVITLGDYGILEPWSVTGKNNNVSATERKRK